ncbi:MAG: Ig-like domain-containing protein, partial [Chloroflexi bacterium]|nr:Ig-like domain-containing protein [Chloroflexota bacterium]
ATPAFGDVDIALTSVITVTFNQPMDHMTGEAAFSLSSDKGNNAAGKFRWDEKSVAMTFTPSAKLDLGTTYTLAVATSAKSIGGGAAMSQPYSSTFTTVPYPGVASTTPANGTRDAEVYGGFSIHFSAPMNVATLDDNVTILPKPTQVYTYWSDYDKSYNINWDFNPSTDYEVTLGPNMADPYGNTLGQPTVVKFTTKALDPAAYLNTNGNIGTYNAYTDTVVYATTRNVHSVDLSLYQLDPDTFGRLTGPNSYDEQRNFTPDPNTRVREWKVPVEYDLNKLILTKLNIASDSGGALAPGLYYLNLNSPELGEFSGNQKYFLVVSGANLTMKVGLKEVLIWATDLSTGQPLPNLPIAIRDQNFNSVNEGKTDADGLFKTNISGQPDLYATLYAVSQGGPGLDSFALATSQWSSGIEPWDFNLQGDYYGTNYQAYFYTDRPVYRPGQTVNFRAVLRAEDDARYTVPDLAPIPVGILDDKGEEVYSQTLKLSEFGTISGQFTLSDEAGTGYYNINAKIPGEPDHTYGVGFQVAEYRKPEFLVDVATDKSAVVQGDTIEAKIDSKFFFGGAVSNADVHWSLLSSSYFFNYDGPGGYFEFTDFDWSSGESGPVYGEAGELIAEGDGKTDANGMLTLRLPADIKKKPTSQTFTAEATVTDVNGQAVSGRTAIIVHQGSFYIGLRPEQYVGTVGEPQTVNIVVSDWNSKPVPNQQIRVVFSKHEWFSVQEQDANGNNIFTWDVKDTPVFTTTATTDAGGMTTAAFTPDAGGTYKVLATGQDSGGHTVRSSTILWISSHDYVTWRQDNNDRIRLIADRKSYAPGDTAKILIPSPFQGEAKALITVERGHILEHEVITLASNSTTYQLPITAEFAPNVFVSVVIVKGVDENNPTPGFRLGLVQLKVSPEQQEIKVSLTPDKAKVGPRDTVTYGVKATDYKGNPVKAEFSLGLADLAALSLAPPNAGPILDAFYGTRALSIRTALGLTLSVDRLNVLAAQAKGGGGGGGAEFFEVRQKFLDTAFWSSSVVTDDKGQASVSITLPDNLTTWRLDARGITANSLVGQNTVDIVATKDLLIRPTTPRFFVVGDQVELGAVVNNNTANAIDAQVGLTAKGVTVAGDAAQTINVPAKGRANVTWRVTALDAPAADLTFSVS